VLDVTNNYRDLEDSDVATAVLPVGAIEQHGPHLPLSTDWTQAEAVSSRVAERLDAFLLPGMPYGCSQAHVGFRGSISISLNTLSAVVKDIANDLLDQGFKRILVLNFHGGNLSLKLAVRELNAARPEGKVVLSSPFRDLDRSAILEGDSDAHAGEFETSVMLHLFPDQVGDERVDHVPDRTEEYFDYAPLKDICPEGVWGLSSLATADKGERLLVGMVEQTTAYALQTFERLGV